MLSLIMLEKDEADRQTVCQALRQCCREADVPLNALPETDSPREALRFLREEKGTVLLMLSAEEGEDVKDRARLALEVCRQNRDNYVVLLLHHLQMLERFVNLNIRPSGVLLKPVHEDKAVKVLRRIAEDYGALCIPEGHCLVLRVGSAVRRLPFSQILYVEARDKKLHVNTRSQCISLYESMKSVAQTLEGNGFLQCHRAFLVNLAAVTEVDLVASELRLLGGHRVPVARSAREEVRVQLLENAEV